LTIFKPWLIYLYGSLVFIYGKAGYFCPTEKRGRRQQAAVAPFHFRGSPAGRPQHKSFSTHRVAVAQMDSATQQNATRVEEIAAAVDALSAQAQSLVGPVTVFKL
jgi:hypothetical protein